MATKKENAVPEVQDSSQLAAAIVAGVQAAVGAEKLKVDPSQTSEAFAASKLRMKNSKGEMLRCEFTLRRRKDAPDPLSITVNEERIYLPRGVKAVVPWYFVQHMLLNAERIFRTERELMPSGVSRPVLKAEDQLTETFDYRPIDPAPDNPPFAEAKMIKE